MFALDRRSFLTGSVGAALGSFGLASRASAAWDTRKRKFTMALVPGSLGVKADQWETIRLADKYGFESVEPVARFLAELSSTERDALLAEMKAKKLAWAAAGLPVDFRGDEEKFRDGLRQLPRLAEGLGHAGAQRVGTWISPSHPTLTYLANFRQHARRLGEVATILADQGLRLGLEYVGPKTSYCREKYPFMHTMAEAKDLIAEIGRDNVGLVLDSWHWYTAGDTEADLLALTNQEVVACDLNDAPAGIPVDQQMDLSRELPCATGVIDVKTFLSALVKIGYDGPIRAEPFNKALRAMPAEDAVLATATAMRGAFALVQ